MTAEKPIILMSHLRGLSVLVRPGSVEVLKSGNESMKHGSWINFQNGRAVIPPERIVRLWGDRENAIAWLKQHRRFGRDFQIAPDTASPAKTTGEDPAPGAGPQHRHSKQPG